MLCFCKIKPNWVEHVLGTTSLLVLEQNFLTRPDEIYGLCFESWVISLWTLFILEVMISLWEYCSKTIRSRNRMSYLCKSRAWGTHCSFWSNGSLFWRVPGGTLSSLFTLQQRRGTLKRSQSLIICPRSSSLQPAVTSTEAWHTFKWFEEFLCAAGLCSAHISAVCTGEPGNYKCGAGILCQVLSVMF